MMMAMRYPPAVVLGGAMTAALFWGLWMVVRPMDVIIVHPVPVPELGRTVRDSEPLTKTQPPKPDPVDPLVVLDPIPGPPVDKTRPVSPVTPFAFEGPVIGGPGGTLTLGSDSEPVPVIRFEPVYPERALARGIEGWVLVQFTISANGTVKDLVLVDASPENVFERAALQAVERWRYNPKIVEGQAVEQVGVQTLLEFKLSDD